MSDIRWKQRFDNFERAFGRLRDGLGDGVDDLSDLEKEGIVQRFEYTFELAWKTLKDFLQYSGIQLDPVSPRSVLKQGFAADILKDGALWINMLDQRNAMSHTYDEQQFEAVMAAISEQFFAPLCELYAYLKEKSVEE